MSNTPIKGLFLHSLFQITNLSHSTSLSRSRKAGKGTLKGALKSEITANNFEYTLDAAVDLLESFSKITRARLKAVEARLGVEQKGQQNVKVESRRNTRPSISGRTLWTPSILATAPHTAFQARQNKRQSNAASASLPTLSSASNPKNIHIFIDNSNILCGLLNVFRLLDVVGGPKGGENEEDGLNSGRIILDHISLVNFLADGRQVEKCVVVASENANQSGRLKRMFDKFGFSASGGRGFSAIVLQRLPAESQMQELPRTFNNDSIIRRSQEQGVDECLHHAIALSLLDYDPATLVLATGDGSPSLHSSQGEGFPGLVARALKKGWNVEVASWSASLSPNFLQRFGHDPKFKLRLLDPHMTEIARVTEEQQRAMVLDR